MPTNNFLPIGSVLNPTGGSRIPGAFGARYVRCVQGLACIGGNYMVPTYTRDDGYGGMTALYQSIGYYDADADTNLSDAQTAWSDGEGQGFGIDTSAGPLTRWYALGLIDDTINPGVDTAVQLGGRVQEFLYGETLLEVTITEQAALQKVTLTVNSGYTIPAGSGANKVAVFALVTDADGASAYYLGAVEPGGSVIDSYDSSILAATNVAAYSPSTFINPRATVALSKFGDSIIYTDNRMDAWTSGIISATITSVSGSETTKVRLRNLAGTGPATDQVSGGTLEWPEWVVRQQLRIEGSNKTYLVASLETSGSGDDNGFRTILVLDETTPLPAGVTTAYFRIVCPNNIQIGHPAIIAQDKVPAAWDLDMSAFFGDDPVVGAITDTDGQTLLAFSTTRVGALVNIPQGVDATGTMGATLDTLPLFDGFLPFDGGACCQGAIIEAGPERAVLAFDIARGPYILVGRTAQFLDPQRKLAHYYEAIAGAEDYPRCKGAYDQRQRVAIWTFPTSRIMFVYSFESGGLGLWQIGDFSINSLCSLIQTAGDGSTGGEAGATEIGTYFLFGLEGGDLVDMMTTAFCDFYRINYEYSFTVDTVSFGSLIVTGINFNPWMRGCTLRIVDIADSATASSKNTFAARVGSTAPLVSVTLNSPGAGQTTFVPGTWTGTAPSAGDIVAICPIDARWDSGKLDSGGKWMQLVRVENIDGSMPTDTTGWGIRFGVNASGNLSDPYAGAETVTYIKASRAQLGRVMPLVNSRGGKSVALSIRFWQPYNERLSIDSIAFVAEGAELR